MTFAQLLGGAALFASTVAGAAAPAPTGSSRASAIGRPTSTLRLEYTDFSKLYGDRAVMTADSRFGIGNASRVAVSLSGGQCRGSGARSRAPQGAVGVDRQWSDRLSTRTSASVASNGSIFAKAQLGQDVSYEIGDGLVATVGGKYASYGHGTNLATLSAGAAYYFRGATLSYRFSLLDSSRLGRSQAHLASVRLKDSGGSGSTQLWVGHGSSLYAADLPRSGPGKFTSVALQRSQPIGGGIAVNLGINRAWYRTPTGTYHGTGALVGLSVANWPR